MKKDSSNNSGRMSISLFRAVNYCVQLNVVNPG